MALLALLDSYCTIGRNSVDTGEWLARHWKRMAALRSVEIPGYLAIRVRNAADAFKVSLRSRLIPVLWRNFERRNKSIPRFLRRPAAANDIIRRNDIPRPYGGDAVLFPAELPARRHPDIHEGWHRLV